MKITWIQPYYDLILYEIPNGVKSILDVGAGYGILGYIMKKARRCTVNAIEPFEYELNHYDQRFKTTWQEYFKNHKQYHDVLVSTEMIEHLSKEDALDFLDQAKSISDRVIIATPYSWEQQEAYDDNPLQVHRSLITTKDFLSKGYRVKYMGVMLWSNRIIATRFYYIRQLKPILRLFGIRPTNIIGVWKK